MIATALNLAASGTGKVHGPHIDWAGLSPLVAVLGGVVLVLMTGLLRPRFIREQLVPGLTLVSLGTALGLTIWQLDERKSLVADSLQLDGLSTTLTVLFLAAGMAATLLAWRAMAPRESAHGEFFAMVLTSIAGMIVLVWSQDMITLFLGLELLSIPLYVLCATEMRRPTSLESGLKYLIVGSVGSATLLYGLAMIYGATGSTNYGEIATAFTRDSLSTDSLALVGIALVVVGMCFKCSVAPFHQWTPDVYEGAPSPITAFMAVATKAAAFGVFLRFFDVALIDAQGTWGPALAVLATITILVGNVGALGQSSLKRMLAYSSVAQAGYMLAGVIVSTQLGVRATVFYLAAYLLMNLAAFGVIIARERETDHGDDISAVAGLGTSRPLLAWPLTISMLALAGVPATAGFIGKFQLIRASVDGDYAWLGIVIVIGSMISLGYYLRVVAAVWSRDAADAAPAPGALPALAGGSAAGEPSAPPAGPAWEVTAVAVVFGAATIVFGVIPQPLFDFVERASGSFTGLF